MSAPKHYNDLVSVEYTRDYNTGTMDWGRLWPGSNAGTYWGNLILKYGLEIDPIATDFVADMIEKVITPDVDPHPEAYGQYVLSRAFADVLMWQPLDRHTITFAANGASGAMDSQVIVGVDSLPAFANINAHTFSPAEGYYLAGWNTSANGGGTAYSPGQYVGISSDIELYAQWTNIYTVTVHHSFDSAGLHTQDDTGPMECYALWIEGVEQPDLGAFSNPARTYSLPYGTAVGVIAQTKSGEARSYITWNGEKVADTSSDARWGFTVTSHLDIHFEWNYWIGDWLVDQSYWNCYITTK